MGIGNLLGANLGDGNSWIQDSKELNIYGWPEVVFVSGEVADI